ncbi:MAG: cadherin-like domain-containing protein [Gammaproteobacteria bacterium]|nr:cadherin-like domain-containing protein [Gammaproteobacteria bacterium]
MPANNPPTAVADSFTAAEDTVITDNVLANDNDPEGSELTAQLISGPASGGLTSLADGSFTYTPNEDFAGTDSFTYEAIDARGGVSDPVEVTLTLEQINDAPTAVGDAYGAQENTTLQVCGREWPAGKRFGPGG